MSVKRILILLAVLIFLFPSIYGYTKVTVMAPAVAQTRQGWIGVASYVTVWAEPGEGRVFVDTYPLTQIDTQGSVRLAAEAAASLIGKDLSKVDIYAVIRSDSAVIGGPSAGGTLSVAILASLLNKTVDPKVVMTGTINPDGTIGPIGGVLQKAEAAHSVGATRFLVPRGQTVATETPTSGKIVDVADYAMKNWNLTLTQVDDLAQAAKWMIGVEITPPSGENKIDLKKYNEIMRKASEDMIQNASSLIDEAETALQSASLTYGQREGLKQYLDDAIAKMKQAKKFRDQEDYYLSASSAFQSKINSTYVKYSLQYFASPKSSTAKKLIESVEGEMRRALDFVNETGYTSVTAFECFAAGEKRAQEAYHDIDAAWQDYYRGDIPSALWQAAYVYQRADSARWWAGLSEEFPGEIETNLTILRSLAQEHIADLKYLLAYAQSFGQSGSSLLKDASDILDDVQKEFDDGAYAAALLESLRSRSYVNAYLELAPSIATGLNEKLVSTLEEKVDREKGLARDAIARSREYGVNPIVAISHLESGESYAENIDPNSPVLSRIGDLFHAFIELKYARLMAEMSPSITQRLGGEVGKAPTPRITPVSPTTETVYRTSVRDAVAIASIFLLLGLAVGLLWGRRGSEKKKYGI